MIINKKGIRFSRRKSVEGKNSYDLFSWGSYDVVQRSWRDNSITFEQLGVEFPTHWSETARNIVTTKYFRGAINTDKREGSLKEVVERVARTYRDKGIEGKYFYSENDADIFYDELVYSLLAQEFSFNSPVWFNVGTKSPHQVSACYILAVEDKMEDILEWYKEEGLIFKGGSGAGVNLSNLRSSKELLSSGGSASGPVSFMRGADASAGTIKSGGATRRAAKMVILDVNHPDIVEFVETKEKEEEKIKVLRNAGYDMDLGGKDTISVQYQNANNSVRVNDEFMNKAVEKKEYQLLGRDGRVVESINASDLLDKIAKAAWSCADPGLQYDNEIQRWHTLPKNGRITASNPCSEFLHLDNSSCNLASIKLTSFLSNDRFLEEDFSYLVRLITVACEISIYFGHFPTKKIKEVTTSSRPIGLGYTDLGALLMLLGLPYDSEEGRDIAASITSLLTAKSYETSSELAKAVGAFKYYDKNKVDMARVITQHRDANSKLNSKIKNNGKLENLHELSESASRSYENSISSSKEEGFRNSQVTVLAPTGTISFFMDSTTTGIEPEFSLIKFKKVADGSSINIVNKEVSAALKKLDYSASDIAEIEKSLLETSDIYTSKSLRENDYSVFSCAVGKNSISPMGHIKMMAAVQPFLSGAISKTVNLPENATVQDIREIYIEGWRLKLKAIAVYRDNCKVGQPLSTKNNNTKEEKSTDSSITKPHPSRVRLPQQRRALTTSFNVGGAEGYMTAGEYEDGELGELFLKISKQGSTLAGVMDAFAIAVSIGLQYGVPLETFIEKFTNSRFEPSGMTNDRDIRMASSIMDYVFRRLAIDHLSEEKRKEIGILTNSERSESLDNKFESNTLAFEIKKINNEKSEETSNEAVVKRSSDSPFCFSCGVEMRRAGSCYVCPDCASTSGCS